ncbi:MAG: hypothetical protein JOZ96_22990 [Acidobacteria bacterium]|nr:hypothetical protein [Acidobacteriota bacterium]
MDIDPFKAVALISGILAILDKLYTYGKSAYHFKKKVTRTRYNVGGTHTVHHAVRKGGRSQLATSPFSFPQAALLRNLFPELRAQVQLVHRLDKTADVVAEDFAEGFVDLRCAGLVLKRGTELRLCPTESLCPTE